jgi:hypothetical protein
MSEMDVRGDDRPFDEDELPVEAPEADAAEQHRDLVDDTERPRDLPLEADPADAEDQQREVGLDDDDYR